MRLIIVALLLLLVNISCYSNETDIFTNQNIEITFPEIIVKNVQQDIDIRIIDEKIARSFNKKQVDVIISGTKIEAEVINGVIILPYTFDTKETLTISIGSFTHSEPVNPIPLWFSILPPLIAILIALVIREVYTALFAGIWVGTTIIYFYKGSLFLVALFKGLLAILDTYIIQSLNNSGHLAIILFSMIIAATVSLISKNGGMKGVVTRLSKYATSPRSGSFITWLLGLIIFFDDYANTLVVGNTMRPLADKLRISREKLSYIIDSTAAPVASVAFVTTWIGAELSYIQDGINTLNINESAYGVFFNSLAYSFYPFFTLAFVVILIWKKVDYGPMLKAEKRARHDGSLSANNNSIDAEIAYDLIEEISAKKGVTPRSLNAVIPILVIIIGTLSALLYTGWNQQVWNNNSVSFFEKLSETIGQADSYIALLWASLGSLFTALALTLSQRLLSLKDAVESIIQGFKTMLPAIMILTLAWSVALITEHMHTADFISGLLMDASVSPYLLPVITFIIAALVSFSTGSSWGTMAILYPLILPSGWLLAENSGLDYDTTLSIFHNLAAAVLTGSVLGDHCSPISDTTILSSLASSCPHIEHVRTQLPYALTTGAVAIFLGTLPASFGISPWILFPIGIGGLYLVIHIFGKPSEKIKVVD
ncbi:MAG: Na+/H+ antiporter NhaC family protein [Bacteroidetes bacterium]|nr:Na+/H+ antiporter NhaC family protein [Bacteroidota bacterium]MBL6943842.1 Na+/H+ antiporter NhaC family protein [Bacteroidales bacterium]